MRYFTADTHFGHTNVIKFCERPFENSQIMDEKLIENWNSVVKPTDVIYHLGDFSFHGMKDTADMIGCLNGYKILVRGNHDHRERKMVRLGFDLVVSGGSIKIADKVFTLSHFPFQNQFHDDRDFNEKAVKDNKIDFHLHGHVHQHWKKKGRMINVGVDVWDYKPVSEKQIMELVGERNDK